MDSHIADNERIRFAERLRSALLAACQPTEPSAFARAYNLRAGGAAVTLHAARKWLRGEAIPTQSKVLVVARWLNVHPAWLRFGEADNGATGATDSSTDSLSTQDLLLIRDVRSMSEASQIVVRDLVDSLLRAAARACDIARQRNNS